MAKMRKRVSGGHNGGRYPNGHIANDPACVCDGCLRRRKIAADKEYKRQTEAIERLRRIQQLSATDTDGVQMPTSGIAKGKLTVPRSDLDRGQDWGA